MLAGSPDQIINKIVFTCNCVVRVVWCTPKEPSAETGKSIARVTLSYRIGDGPERMLGLDVDAEAGRILRMPDDPTAQQLVRSSEAAIVAVAREMRR